jgi:putative ABC transport system permease protein
LQLYPQLDHDPAGRKLQAGYDSYRLIGRVESKSKRPQAEAEIDLAFQRYRSDQGDARADDRSTPIPKARLFPASAGWTELRQPLGRPLAMLMAAVGLVLLIACANVAGLTLARGAARMREFSLRSALGAPRRRLIGQSLTESLLLALVGGVLGLVLAHWGIRLLAAALPLQNGAPFVNFTMDTRVMWFTAGVCLATGVLSGLIPALRNSSGVAATMLRGSGMAVAGSVSRNRWLNGLVVTQVALSMTLLMGAGLFIRTLGNLRGEAPFHTERLIQFGISHAFAERPSPPEIVGKLKDILSRLENAPGVDSASLYLFGLMSGNGYTQKILPEGYTSSPGEDLSCRGVLGGYGLFKTLDIPLVSGRDFTSQDELRPGDANPAARRVAVINRSMAKKYFGDADPLGRQFHFQDREDRKYEIVGVVADVKYGSLRQETPPTFYLPFFQQPMGGPISFVLRTRADPHSVIPGLRSLVAQVDPALVVQDVRTMDEVIGDAMARERLVARLGGFFGIVALALAALGLYGLLSFAVVQRTREIAVRVALGAQSRNIRSLVFGRGVKLVMLGLGIGLAGAFGAARLALGLLYDVSAADPVTAACVSLLFAGVALLAGWAPARRAVNLDPMRALKEE